MFMLKTFISRVGIYTVAKFNYKGCYKIVMQDLNRCKMIFLINMQ